MKASNTSSNNKKVTIICNPFAGRGLATKMAKQAEAFANTQNWKVLSNVESQYAGHIENELVSQLDSNLDLIILIGGDGTLRELIAGLRKNKTQIDIGFIPMGNANVVARELEIPLTPSLALQMLQSSRTVAIDIGTLEMTANTSLNEDSKQHIFLAMLEIGLGAQIVHLVNTLRLGKLKRLYQIWGDLVYAIAGVLAFTQKNPPIIGVENKRLTENSRHIIISNMRTYAKGWALTPKANCQDGLLDLAVNKKGSRLSTLATFISAAQRRKSPETRMRYIQATEFSLKGSSKAFMQVDGDPILFQGNATVKIEPKAFQIHVPLKPKY